MEGRRRDEGKKEEGIIERRQEGGEKRYLAGLGLIIHSMTRSERAGGALKGKGGKDNAIAYEGLMMEGLEKRRRGGALMGKGVSAYIL